MIFPPLPCLTIWRPTACRVKKSPAALTAKTRSKLFPRDLEDGRQVEDGGVVDQDVDAAGAGDDRLDHPVDRLLPRHVQFDGEGRLPERRSRGPGLLEQDIGDGDAGPLGYEPFRDRPADPAGAARDDGDFSFKYQSFHGPFSCHLTAASATPPNSSPSRGKGMDEGDEAPVAEVPCASHLDDPSLIRFFLGDPVRPEARPTRRHRTGEPPRRSPRPKPGHAAGGGPHRRSGR